MKEVEITKDNFEEEVLKSKMPVLVDFWATWCGPCTLLAPHLESIARNNDDIKIGKINVDQEDELCAKFAIMNIPTLILFKDGKTIKTAIGYHTKDELQEFIKI